jgi:hypothetical protein
VRAVKDFAPAVTIQSNVMLSRLIAHPVDFLSVFQSSW